MILINKPLKHPFGSRLRQAWKAYQAAKAENKSFKECLTAGLKSKTEFEVLKQEFKGVLSEAKFKTEAPELAPRGPK